MSYAFIPSDPANLGIVFVGLVLRILEDNGYNPRWTWAEIDLDALADLGLRLAPEEDFEP